MSVGKLSKLQLLDECARLRLEMYLLRDRNKHLEIELAQARFSRDQYADKYKRVAEWMKAHVALTREGGLTLVRSGSPPPSESSPLLASQLVSG